MQEKKQLRKRVAWQGTLFICLLIPSFIYGAGFDASNGLWVIPIIAAFIGVKFCNETVSRLDREIRQAYGHDKEEYW